VQTKICSKCHIEKSVSEFYKNKRNDIRSECKMCGAKINLKYQKTEKYKNTQKKYRENNKKFLNLLAKNYRENNKDKIKIYSQKHYCDNREKYSLYARQWREKHLEHIKMKNRKYLRKRRNEDIEFKIIDNLRRRIHHAIKGNSKSNISINLIGCSIIQLKQHLESQFKLGMNWNNYKKGGWVIDHKIPCKAFNMTDAEQQKICFNFKNLQPLWDKENANKGGKFYGYSS
jgi:hypothetical protein